MNLLVYSAYYEPEVAASMYLSTNLYEDFAASGMKVRLYVPLPTRGVPDRVRKQYRSVVEKRIDGNLEIIRLNIPKERKNPILRAIRYLWMNVRFVLAASSYAADAIFVQSTPPTQGAMAAIIKKKKKIPFIYNLQDIFPDSLIGAGMTTEKSVLYRIGRRIESFTYRNADRIIVISEDMKRNIVLKGVPEEKVIVIPNWIDSEAVYPVPKEDNYLFEKYSVSKEAFTVVYAGNLGYAQNIDVIIRAAGRLKKNHNIQFLIIGSGAQEEEYKKLADGLDNIRFLPMQPYSEVSFVYSLGDASIVSCKEGFGGSAMPSKTWGIMATGRPVLACFDRKTELERIITEENVGLFCDSNDDEALAQNILELVHNQSLRSCLSDNARNYVKAHLKRASCTERYVKAVKETQKPAGCELQ